MTSVRTVLKNSAILITTRIVTKVATTFLMIYIARKLGDSEFGIYSSILVFVALFGLIEECGLTVPLIRRIARHESPPSNLLGEVFFLKLLLSVPAFACLLCATFWIGSSTPVVLVFGVCMVLEVLNVSVVRSFEGVETMRHISTVTIIERVTLCAGGVMVLYLGGALLAFAFVQLFSDTLSLGVAMVLWRRDHQQLKMSISFSRAKVLVIEAIPFAVAGLFSVIYNRVDTLILMGTRTSSEVGWYNAAFRITDALLFIPTAIVASVFPVLSRSFSASRDDFVAMYGKFLFILIGVGVVIGAVTFSFSAYIILHLYGKSFSNAIDALAILSFMVPFFFSNVFLGYALIAIQKERHSTAAIIAGALVNTALNLALVWKYGEYGSAVAKVLTEVFSFALQLYFFHRVIEFGGTYTAWLKKKQ